jgi:hypothetical protein
MIDLVDIMSSFPSMRAMGFLWVRVCLLLLGLGSRVSVWAADPVTIDITTTTGKQTYEIVRLYPDRVVLLESSGNRLEMQRSKIQKSTNKKVESSIKEAKGLLSKVQSTSWKGFPDLAKTIEQTATEMDQTSLLYGWLIPDASKTAAELQAIDSQVSQVLVTGTALEKDLLTLQTRVKNGEHLPKDWNALLDGGVKRASEIPFPLVQKQLTARIQAEKEGVVSLVQQISTEKTGLIAKAEEDLRTRIKNPSISREEWTRLLNQMRQTASQIPDDHSRDLSLSRIEEISKQTEPLLLQAESRRAYAGALNQLEAIRSQVSSGEIAPVTGQERIRAFLTILAGLPEAPTREQLATQANKLAAQLAPAPVNETEENVEGEGASGQAANRQTLIPPILASKLAMGGVVGVGLSVGGLLWLSRRKKKVSVKQQSGPVPTPKPQVASLPDFAPLENVIPLPVRSQPSQPPAHEETIPPSSLPVSTTQAPVEILDTLTVPVGEQPIPLTTQEDDLVLPPRMEVDEKAIEEEPEASEVVEAEPLLDIDTVSAGTSPFEQEVPTKEPESSIVDEAGGMETLPGIPSIDIAPEVMELIAESLPDVIPETTTTTEEVHDEEPPHKLDLDEERELPPPPPPLPTLTIALPESGEDWRSALAEACVNGEDLEEKLRDSLVLGEGIPEELATHDRYFAVSMRSREGKMRIILLDRLSMKQAVQSIADCGAGSVVMNLQFGLLWIINQEGLRVMGLGENGWNELGRLDHPVTSKPETSQHTLFWVGEKFLVSFSESLRIYKSEREENLLHIEALDTSMVQGLLTPDPLLVFPTLDDVGVLTSEGVLTLMDLSVEGRSRRVELPDCSREVLLCSCLNRDARQLLYPVMIEGGVLHLRLMSLSSLETVCESEDLPFSPRQIIPVEEGFLLFGEHDVAFFDGIDLSINWTYALGSKVPVRLSGGHSQLALLVREEEGDTVLVLGKNSGADLWDLTPSEHGLKRIQGLVFHADWTLLLGQDEKDQAVLKLC